MILALAFIQNSGSQTTFQYDPWADINDDGKIDMKDIGYICRLFGTTGDPTKNVNVINFPQTYRIMHTTYTYAEKFHAEQPSGAPPVWRYFNTEGYRQITIALSINGNASVTIWWAIPNGGCWDQYHYFVKNSYNFTAVTYQVIAPELYISFCSFIELPSYKHYQLNATVTLGIYMTT
jgi:hypothetical protein